MELAIDEHVVSWRVVATTNHGRQLETDDMGVELPMGAVGQIDEAIEEQYPVEWEH